MHGPPGRQPGAAVLLAGANDRLAASRSKRRPATPRTQNRVAALRAVVSVLADRIGDAIAAGYQPARDGTISSRR